MYSYADFWDLALQLVWLPVYTQKTIFGRKDVLPKEGELGLGSKAK
jgi:hypothetical protein